jgi:hypothetical protein
MRRTGGWTTTLLGLGLVIGGGGALVLAEMWSGPRDETVHLANDEMLATQPPAGEPKGPQHSAVAVNQATLASRHPSARHSGDVDAVSQAIKELHDASQAKASTPPGSSTPAYDLGGLSASSDSLVGRADQAADAADAARGAHAAGKADAVRSQAERSDNLGRQGTANPAH